MFRANDVWDDYRDWLIYRVNFKKKGYNLLIDELHNSPFEYILPRDENRMDDARSFRSSFFYEQGLDGAFIDRPIGVLEVLVVLAMRIENEYIGDPGNPHPEHIFWEMICNLGLNKFDDVHFKEQNVYEILSIWINREFDFNGNGSIFPLRARKNDQRKIEIWSQMKAYLSEKCSHA